MARVISRHLIIVSIIMESVFDEVIILEMADSSESAGLQPTKEGNQATAPGFQPSGGIASTTRALTHAVRSQYLAKHKGEDRATADRREHMNAYVRTIGPTYTYAERL